MYILFNYHTCIDFYHPQNAMKRPAITLKKSVRTWIAFGITSGIITTMGLIIGLSLAGATKLLIVWGILTIAVADSLSDSLGMFISEEADQINKMKSVRSAALATFLAKFLMALLFIIPFYIADTFSAVWICIVRGLLGLFTLSREIADIHGKEVRRIVRENILVWVVVIVVTYFVGIFISHLTGAK